MTRDQITALEKATAKFNMIGVSIDIKNKSVNKSRLPVLNDIKDLRNVDKGSKLIISAQSLNNGNIILSEELLKNSHSTSITSVLYKDYIAITDINPMIQSQTYIRKVLFKVGDLGTPICKPINLQLISDVDNMLIEYSKQFEKESSLTKLFKQLGMLLYWFDAKEYSLVSNVHEVYYYSRGIYKYTGNDGMTDIDILQRNISTLSTNLKIKDFNESEVQTILSIIKQMLVLALQVCCNGYAHSYIENVTLTENQLKNNLLYASNYKPIRVRCTPECEAKLGQLIKCTENLAKMIQDKGLYTHLLISKHYK